jgi:hypothetical protein
MRAKRRHSRVAAERNSQILADNAPRFLTAVADIHDNYTQRDHVNIDGIRT